MRQDAILSSVVDAICHLPDIWAFFCANDPRVVKLNPGIEGLTALSEWMATGETSSIANSTAGIVALPLLMIIHIAQYFQLLRNKSIRHEDLVQAVASGAGIQGFCTGFPMAVIVSSSSNEDDLAGNACNAIRLMVGIGIYSDLGVVAESNKQMTMVVRLKAAGQAQGILDCCPSVSDHSTSGHGLQSLTSL